MLIFAQYISGLTSISIWAKSADDKLTIFFFLFCPENRLRYFMQIVETICMKSKTFSWAKETAYSRGK